MSNAERRIPAAPTPPGGGNLLSSVAPPAELPSFLTAAAPAAAAVSAGSATPVVAGAIPASQLPPSQVTPKLSPPVMAPTPSLADNNTISSSKLDDASLSEETDDSQVKSEIEETQPDYEQIGNVMPGSALVSWLRGGGGGGGGGGVLSRVARSARSHVDTLLTTLDPQMAEYLKSGGDVFVAVATDAEEGEGDVAAVREAFQRVFGRATVVGVQGPPGAAAAGPAAGHAAALAAARRRAAQARGARPDLADTVPVVAVEGFTWEGAEDCWFESHLLLLSQPSVGELQVLSQAAPAPRPAAAAAAAAAGAGQAAGQPTETAPAAGVPRREVIALAARALANLYQRRLHDNGT